MNNDFIKILEPNVDGRDFVIGDLQGCYKEFSLLLKYISFNNKIDRIICTGNLSGRGPESEKCLDLLKEDWFFSVLGNSEESILNKIEKKEKSYKYEQYKGNIEKLPIIYKIEHLLHDNIYVLHGEIIPEHLFEIKEINSNNKEYQRYINSMHDFDFSNKIINFFNKYTKNKLDNNLKQKLLWSRKNINEFYKKHMKKFDDKDYDFINNLKIKTKLKIFSGHNTVPYPIKIGQQYYIDTGVSLSYPNNHNNETYTFPQLGSQIYALSLVDITTGVCYGCLSSSSDNGKIVTIKNSIYE